MSGAIADDDGVSVADRLEPEEVAADDVSRLPDQEMIVAHGGELAQLRQDRGLDAPRIAQLCRMSWLAAAARCSSL